MNESQFQFEMCAILERFNDVFEVYIVSGFKIHCFLFETNKKKKTKQFLLLLCFVAGFYWRNFADFANKNHRNIENCYCFLLPIVSIYCARFISYASMYEVFVVIATAAVESLFFCSVHQKSLKRLIANEQQRKNRAKDIELLLLFHFRDCSFFFVRSPCALYLCEGKKVRFTNKAHNG